MDNAKKMRAKIASGQTCYGSYISSTDPVVTEALSSFNDFFWIDAEHNALTLETIQLHLMATRDSDAAGIVRVPWNDPVLIKPVLDIGADGIIVPFVRTADDVRRAVAACRYPPDGIRGYGPRRANRFGKRPQLEYIKEANENIIIVAQIEHVDALNHLDEILAVPGLTSIQVGPNDLSGTMGLFGQPNHPEVVKVIQTIVDRTLKTKVWASVSVGGELEYFADYVKRGVQWMPLSGDIPYMLSAARQMQAQVRALAEAKQ
jgi:2-keto-3-deoxy-L-rhamnonate aldolase RhmA